MECGNRLDAIGTADGTAAMPSPGDPIACIRCGAVMTIDENAKMRGFTEPEMDELTSDVEAMNNLSRMVQRIHVLRHAAN
jgi:hypothetical protein